MEWLNALITSHTIPPVSALILGILVAVDSCTLATAITAIGYIARDLENRRQAFLNGLLYTLGRTITYFTIAAILAPIIRQGAHTHIFEEFLAKYSGLVIGPFFILLGLFMLFGRYLKLPSLSFSSNPYKRVRHRGWGALLMGMLFALAICPAIGAIYFGMLLPMTATSSWGLWLPLIFAVATALPVIVAAWLLAFSLANVGRFYQRMQVVQKWLNIAVAMLFILSGVQMIVESRESEHAHCSLQLRSERTITNYSKNCSSSSHLHIEDWSRQA